MKLRSSWGITTNWWRGNRAGYGVIVQGILLIIFALVHEIVAASM